MVDLKNVDLLALQSRYMQGDITTQALCAALTPMFQELADQIIEVVIYPRIDELSGSVLDALAWGFHVDSYDALADDAEKRRMIKSSVVAHKFKGTAYSVRTIVESIFGTSGSVLEWFQYGGNPYYFKVIVDTYLRGISESDYSRLISGIEPYKSLRSILESVTAKLRSEASFGLGVKTLLGDISVIFPDVSAYDQEKSGQTVTITGVCANTHFQALHVTGATSKTGSGTKSPENPYTINGTTKVTINGTDYPLPQILYDLPNVVHDSYDAVSGSGTKNVGKIVLNGSETWGIAGEGDTTAGISFYANIPGMKSASTTIVQHECDRFQVITYGASKATPKPVNFLAAQTTVIILNIERSKLTTQDTSGLKKWLAANPVSVLYQLAVPQTITGTAQQISAIEPTSNVSVDGGSVMVKYNPYLEAVNQRKTELNGRG